MISMMCPQKVSAVTPESPSVVRSSATSTMKATWFVLNAILGGACWEVKIEHVWITDGGQGWSSSV